MSATDPRLDFEARLGEHLAERVEPGCLDGDALVELAEQGPSSKGFDRRMAHVAACSRCYELLKDLRAMPALAPEPVRASRRWLWLLVPAGAALVIFALIRQAQDRENLERFVRDRHAPPEVRFDPGFGPPKEPSLEVRRPEPRTETGPAPENPPDPGPEFVPFEPPSPTPAGPRNLIANIAERDGGLYEGDVRIDDLVAADVRAIAGDPENVRGPGQAVPPEIVLSRPEIGNRLLRDGKVSFEWSRHPSATGYDVRLERLPGPSDPGPQPVEIDVVGFSARPKNALEPGQSYRLRIEAKRGDRDPVGERNPFAEYVFRVPDAEETRKLEWAIAHETKAPLSAGMVYRALGRLADAERIIPRSDEPKMLAWRRNIEESLKRRLSEPNR
ncbi:MAG TPA: hypothetical protein PLL78_12845 [Fimbriimonadaceae bacterium]|nr:hypothetical protein [Fimbriimonadaceae bacterium]HRJ97564.1 hypothetical protein [Fimbriimonadaceae bacterium]